MPQVSRNRLSKNAENEVIANLNITLSSIQKSGDMVSFLDSLLTPTEKVMIGKRLAMIVLIEQGLHDSQITDLLHVTQATIAKMRLFYEARGSGFKVALKKLEEQKRLKAFKDTLLEMVEFIGKAGTGHIKKTFS